VLSTLTIKPLAAVAWKFTLSELQEVKAVNNITITAQVANLKVFANTFTTLRFLFCVMFLRGLLPATELPLLKELFSIGYLLINIYSF
jgi:hypothetical protein